MVAFAVACAYSLLAVFVPPGSAASRLVVMTDVVRNYTTYQCRNTIPSS